MTALYKLETELDKFTLYMNTLKNRSDKSKIKELSELRQIPLEIIEQADIFYVKNQAELLVPGFVDNLKDFGVISPTNNRPIFNERWVFPIKNADGKVINFVGYSNLQVERYVYGTSKYYDRTNTLYGLENIRDAYKLGYAILTEGITDSLAVRGLGYKNVFAWCGTSDSKFKIKQLNRCKHGVIRIPDRDLPGERLKKVWEFNRYYTLTTLLGSKDSAEMLSKGEELREYYKECLEIAISWVLSAEHNGRKCASKTGIM